MSDQLLTIEQVAERLQVERQTVLKAIRMGRLEAAKIFRQWRITPAALDTFISESTPIVQIQARRGRRSA